MLPFLELANLRQQIDTSVDYVTLLRRFTSSANDPGKALLQDMQCPSDPGNRRSYFWAEAGIYTPLANYFAVAGNINPLPVPWNGIFVSRRRPGDRTVCGDLNRQSRIRIGFRHVRDGLASTLAIGERGLSDGYWGWTYAPALQTDAYLFSSRGVSPGKPTTAHDAHFWSYHPGGAQFVAADGATHFISYDIDASLFKALGTRNAGEVASLPP
jgi:hypothetical protein